LGINIDDVSEKEALEIVSKWFLETRTQNPEPRLIFTPGPEFLLTAQKDLDFKKILNAGDLLVPDGFGLQLYCGIKNRVAGVDLVLALCQMATEKGWTVGMIGNPNTKKAAEKLLEKFPKLKIIFALDNPEADQILSGCETVRSIMKGNDMVDLLFVGIGHPKQEKFLWQIKNGKLKTKNLCVAMGVGGSFDLISGNLPRAPKIFRVVGLEWFWRMATKPGHIKRGLQASLEFPIVYLLSCFRGQVRSGH